METTALTQGLHHLGLTVPDIEETRSFFVDVLGFQEVGRKPAYPAVFVSDGQITLTLWQVERPETAAPFNRKTTIGLHHFALRLQSHTSLDDVFERLKKTEGVSIEFAPEPLGPGPTRHMMCTIVGGVRMELISPAG